MATVAGGIAGVSQDLVMPVDGSHVVSPPGPANAARLEAGFYSTANSEEPAFLVTFPMTWAFQPSSSNRVPSGFGLRLSVFRTSPAEVQMRPPRTALPGFTLLPSPFVRILMAMHTLGAMARALNRSPLYVSGLQKRFALPAFEGAAYSDAYLAFLRTLVALRTFNIAEETLQR